MTPVQLIISDKSGKLRHDAIDALEAGCKWLQVQFATTNPEKDIKTIAEIKALCCKKEALLVIEDNMELAKKVKADGLYISNGSSETAKKARKFLGESYIIGLAAKDVESIAAAKQAGADYVCAGPFGIGDGNLSVKDLCFIIHEMQKKSLRLPIVAFGDITISDILPIMQSGINGIAFNAAKCNSENIGETIKRFSAI